MVIYPQGADNSVNLVWGIAADGSVMISDNVDLVKASCAKSFAPFPAGTHYPTARYSLVGFESEAEPFDWVLNE